MTNILFSALAAAAAAISVPAHAETPAAETVRIGIADLDLSSNAGQRALEARLSRAVRDLCGTASDADLAGRNEVRQCRTDALAEAHRVRDARLAQRSSETIQLAAR